jgi:hypothetical protein
VVPKAEGPNERPTDPVTMSDDEVPEAGETSIDEAVIGRAADRSGVDAAEFADALVVLHASLIGRHAEFEREYDYATLDETRAYRVPYSVWDDLLGEFDVEDDVADAVEFAHTEQARLVFADAVDADERFGENDQGIVVGVDTAEEF